jgi:hypothetical protein
VCDPGGSYGLPVLALSPVSCALYQSLRGVHKLQDGVNEAVWIYFVVLIILGAFFAVNLALAVLYLQFTQSQAELEVEKEQEQLLQQQRSKAPSSRASLLNSNPDGWVAKLQDRCYNLQDSFWFEFTTMFLIGANTIVMASEYDGMTPAHAQVCHALRLRYAADCKSARMRQTRCWHMCACVRLWSNLLHALSASC